MAQSVRFNINDASFKHGDENFPILFTDGKVMIYKNPTNEIFIEDLRTGAAIRLNADPHGGLQFTTNSNELVEPERVSNMIGWRISRR